MDRFQRIAIREQCDFEYVGDRVTVTHRPTGLKVEGPAQAARFALVEIQARVGQLHHVDTRCLTVESASNS